MSDRRRNWALTTATLFGGALAALSGVGVAAALFPPEGDLPREEPKEPPSPRAAPASSPSSSSAPASAPAELTHGEALGEFRISFYVLTEETSYQGDAADTPLY